MPDDGTPPRLLADIGGTNARFALERAGTVARIEVLHCADHAGLSEAARAYLDEMNPAVPPRIAAFAIASPVTGDRIDLTNHPWSFSIEEERRRLGLDRLMVVNDFTAVAMAIPRLGPGEAEKVGRGAPEAGAPIGVVGPGTGLGVSGLVPHKGEWSPLASEGGHVTLGPADDRESEVIQRMRRRVGHVSAERLVSGPGLVHLYTTLSEMAGETAGEATPEEVTQKGLEGSCARCREALQMFCAMLGTVAGDLALTLGARGGVYIAGGIVPRLGRFFADSAFRARFEDKGRFSGWLAAVPTYVIRHPYPAFLGLAAYLDQEAA